MVKVEKPDVSDDSVQSKTGKTWDEWFAILDTAGAQQMDHKAIVAFLAQEYPTTVTAWWQQKITVTYEQVRGTRQKHEMEDGYQISRSKTVSGTPEVVYQAWSDEAQRAQWLSGAALEKRSESQGASEASGAYIRTHWMDGSTRLDVDFYQRGENRTQVTVQQNRIASAEQAEAQKAFWSAALQKLAEYLQQKGQT